MSQYQKVRFLKMKKKMSDVKKMAYFKGDVKWFNNKAGYGFITVKEDACEVADNLKEFSPFLGKDVFVHHSVIQVTKSVFRYLMPGEQVQFAITVPEIGKHSFQASNVFALDGALKCETRVSRKRRVSSTTYSEPTTHSDDKKTIDETVDKIVTEAVDSEN